LYRRTPDIRTYSEDYCGTREIDDEDYAINWCWRHLGPMRTDDCDNFQCVGSFEHLFEVTFGPVVHDMFWDIYHVLGKSDKFDFKAFNHKWHMESKWGKDIERLAKPAHGHLDGRWRMVSYGPKIDYDCHAGYYEFYDKEAYDLFMVDHSDWIERATIKKKENKLSLMQKFIRVKNAMLNSWSGS